MGISSHHQSFAALAPATGRTPIIGLSAAELKDRLLALGFEAFRTGQIWQWVYGRGAKDFSVMSNIQKKARDQLAEHFIISRPEVRLEQKSADATCKWLLRMDGGQDIECVHIPEEDRGALCISSQVGCTLTCRFCHTGTQRLVRNLETHEILLQIMHARDAVDEWPSGGDLPKDAQEKPRVRSFTNIVLMGMGEPLYNFENVAKAMQIAMSSDGLAFSKRRITLSTSGVVPMMERCGKEIGVNLAVSLHAVSDDLRDQLIPLNRKYPIKELLNACRNYPGASNARRITFEYVMLKGVNDSDADARALVRLLSGIPAKINLIPFNAWPGAPFECSDDARIQRFGDLVNAAGYPSPVRTPRGRDILAACGQLKTESLRLSAAERAAVQKIIAEKEQLAGLASISS